jgi:L-ascorbate metabolism protein UlaG (beta-lactamase superfamily)
MEIQLLRHATLLVTIGARKLLVDPMLSPAEAMDPIPNAGNDRRIPMVDLPMDEASLAKLLATIDAVIVTHTHRDHWDARAAELLRRDLPLFCQPSDAAIFAAAGFTVVTPVEDTISWEGISMARTGGQHGTGDIGQRMGLVSGFVLRAAGEPTLYLAGDTIWCREAEDAFATHHPDIAVLNTGSAQFLVGDPITMAADDVIAVCRAAPNLRAIAVHMEVINHCNLTRAALRASLDEAGLTERVQIPADGERIALA